MEKRKINRIQGNWNNRKVSANVTTPGNKECQSDRSKNVSSQFVYKPSARSKVEDDSSDVGCKIIAKDGNHTLSTGPTGISNVVFKQDFIPTDLHDGLFQSIDESVTWEDKEVTIKGKSYSQPRLVAWYGPFPYEYSGLMLQSRSDVWPSAVDYIHDCIRRETKHEFNSVLINLYRDGKDGMGWHSDDELSMGIHPVIASVSLGDTRRFEMRRKQKYSSYDKDKKAEFVFPLKSGSLLIMDGETQSDWEHRVPKEYHDRRPRINLTFRTVFSKSEHFSGGKS